MKGNRLFVGACCGLGLLAFSQLLVAGMALAVRIEEGREVRVVEKEVEKLVPIRITVPVAGDEIARTVERERPFWILAPGDLSSRGARHESPEIWGWRS
jgi:hypothetical protein